MKTVFIFGAGVSKEAGAPVMADFLDTAHHLRYKNSKQSEVTAAFDDVFDAISELHPIHHRSYLNLNNIEEVFSAIEMAQIIGRLGSLKQERIEKLKGSIVTLIVETLAQTIKFPVRHDYVVPPDIFNQFAKRIKALKHGAAGIVPDIAFITFNYDFILDYALQCNGIATNYCLLGRASSNPEISVPLLKLHGSLNWLRCDECNGITAIDMKEFQKIRFSYGGPAGTNLDLNMLKGCTKEEFKCSRCKDTRPLSDSPVLVPPTWNKSGYHNDIKNVWQEAAKVLSEAENIFVVGYSLPPTDLFFRYLFAMSADSSTWLKRFWVYNPDSEVGDRFRKICGSGIVERFKFIKNSFNNVSDNICSKIEDDLKR